MNAGIRHLDNPAFQFPIQVFKVNEPAAGEEVTLDVLHSRLDLSLGLWPMRLAKPWGESVVTGEVGELAIERWMPLLVIVDYVFGLSYRSSLGDPPNQEKAS